MTGGAAALPSRRPGPARRALREATQDLHERMHGHPALLLLSRGCIGRDAYAALLVGFLRFHRAVEDRLSRGPDLGPFGIDVVARRRSPELLDDLSALGVSVPAMPPCDLAVPESVPAALGYLYVTEGSRLGGRVLARALETTLTPGSAEGRHFLLGEGGRQGQGWGEFCAAVEDVGVSQDARAEMAGAAVSAFIAFEACLGRA